MWLIYDLIIHIYGDAISIAALFNSKARLWVRGRKGCLVRLVQSSKFKVRSRPPPLIPPRWGRERIGFSQARVGAVACSIALPLASSSRAAGDRSFPQGNPDWKDPADLLLPFRLRGQEKLRGSRLYLLPSPGYPVEREEIHQARQPCPGRFCEV